MNDDNSSSVIASWSLSVGVGVRSRRSPGSQWGYTASWERHSPPRLEPNWWEHTQPDVITEARGVVPEMGIITTQG